MPISLVNGAKVVASAAALWMYVIIGPANDGALVKLKNSALNLRLWPSVRAGREHRD